MIKNLRRKILKRGVEILNRDEYEERKSRSDREQLIDGIINNYFDEYRGKSNEKQSIAIFIGGGSGSGKSTLRKKIG